MTKVGFLQDFEKLQIKSRALATSTACPVWSGAAVCASVIHDEQTGWHLDVVIETI